MSRFRIEDDHYRPGPTVAALESREPRDWCSACSQWSQWVSPATGNVSRLSTAVCRVCGVRKPDEGDAA